jgi:glycosyltransferase involved in cell wall biosynthesis
MNYYICQDWKSTSGNHAGMAHLCRMLEKIDTDNKAIVVRKDWHEIKFIRRFRKYIWNFDLYKLVNFLLSLSLIFQIKSNDRIFLIEYLHKERNQHIIARVMRFFFKDKIHIYGMVHLFPSQLEYWFCDADFTKWSQPIDKIITLGTSLSAFLVTKGISEKKIVTTFHYVDREFYKAELSTNSSSKLRVISMGNLYRNYEMLKSIAEKLPDIEFYICKGHDSIEHLFEQAKNVKLYGYIAENELKNLMSQCDVSLNVLFDTIGSNVITTSLSMGLAIVVSDVGSIHDYCNDSNTIFCKNIDDFVTALNKLNQNRDLLNSFKISSLKKSECLSIEVFNEEMKKL